MLIYCHDRRMGRPKQATDVKLQADILITPDMRAIAAREMLEIKEDEAKLLGESNATIKEEE